ncbi:MAG: hypothetical protein L0323_12935 [Planctomycetes bacterium]|nr:hypothetical protein [Planctomycetota bacterium]
MNRRAASWTLAVAAVWLAACAGPPKAGSGGGTVRALRYRVEVFEGTLALAHDEGEWIDELYFPDPGVVCNVVWGMDASPEWMGSPVDLGLPPGVTQYLRPRMNAFFGSMGERRKASRPLEAKGVGDLPLVLEAEVPEDFAREIFALAEANRRVREAESDLGIRAVKGGILGYLPLETRPGR